MDRVLTAILASFALLILLQTAARADEMIAPAAAIWRDAPQNEVESELDLVSRDYVRLANDARPAVVQIRVVPQSDPKTGSKAQQPQGSRGSGFIIHPTDIFLRHNTSSIRQRRSRFVSRISSEYRRSLSRLTHRWILRYSKSTLSARFRYCH